MISNEDEYKLEFYLREIKEIEKKQIQISLKEEIIEYLENKIKTIKNKYKKYIK